MILPDGIIWHAPILRLSWSFASLSEVTICTWGRDTSSGCILLGHYYSVFKANLLLHSSYITLLEQLVVAIHFVCMEDYKH